MDCPFAYDDVGVEIDAAENNNKNKNPNPSNLDDTIRHHDVGPSLYQCRAAVSDLKMPWNNLVCDECIDLHDSIY